MKTEFIVVRHGETDANVNGILQGQSDTQLNERGIRQAEQVAGRLKNDHFDFIFSSDLARAMETARLIAEPHHLPVRKLHALREWNLGKFQGRKLDDLKQQCPEIIAAFHSEIGDVRIPGGESRFDFYQRVADCLDEMPERFAGKRILLVSHGGVLRAVFHHIAGPVSACSRLPLTGNASVSSFRYVDGFWQLTSWNDTSHLRVSGENESMLF